MKRIAAALLLALALCRPPFGQAQQISPLIPTPNPLAGLAASEQHLVSLGPVSLTSNETVNLLNISPGVPGYVYEFHITQSGGNNFKDDIINVYVDGESSPSVTFDVGALLGQFAPTGITNEHLATMHSYTATGAAEEGIVYNLSYPIPFHSSIQITYTSANANTIWTGMGYKLGERLPYKLWSSGRTWQNKLITYETSQIESGTFFEFLNLSSGAGWVVYMSLTAGGQNSGGSPDFSYQECAIDAYLDGAQPTGGGAATGNPQYANNGVEDSFLSGDGFIDGIGSTPYMAVSEASVNNAGYMEASIDFLAFNGGIKFNNGIVMVWELPAGKSSGVVTATAVGAAWLVLYYMPY